MTVISYAPYQYNLSFIQWNTKKVFQLDLQIIRLLEIRTRKNYVFFLALPWKIQNLTNDYFLTCHFSFAYFQDGLFIHKWIYLWVMKKELISILFNDENY